MDSSNERAIEIVKDYISAIDPNLWWQGYTFQELSYIKWFAEELLRQLERQETTPPLLVIEDFQNKMGEYSRLNQKFGFIFAIAECVAKDIVDCLI